MLLRVSYGWASSTPALSGVGYMLRHLPAGIAVIYLSLLCFPQVLFAHELSYRNLIIYSREPLDKSIYDVLDRVESRLAGSEIKGDIKPRIFLTNGFDVYALLSLYIGSNSFGKSYAALPTDNVFINKADVAKDLVFRTAPPNQRSLSGVIAHEITHLWMRKRFGYWRNIAMPTWKKEGYAEYVAGGTTLDYETGLRSPPAFTSGARFETVPQNARIPRPTRSGHSGGRRQWQAGP